MRASLSLVRWLLMLFVAAAMLAGGGPRQPRRDRLYVCACADGCSCGTAAAKPGPCACGKAMGAAHVLRVEGEEALVCACGGDCACKLDAADPSRCGCGKPLRRVGLKGTGVYFCNCGGTCQCNTVAAKAGVCKCGMALKRAS